MMRQLTGWATLIVCMTTLGAQALGPPLEKIEITSEPPTPLERVVINVRWTPTRTVTYDRIEFECTLRQDVDWPARDGSGVIKKPYEPLSYRYRRDSVRLVQDLDQYIHFTVPVGLEELRRSYGATTFPFDAPVRVSRMRVTAYLGNERVWVFRHEVREVEEDEASM